jgi:hypothetical protein
MVRISMQRKMVREFKPLSRNAAPGSKTRTMDEAIPDFSPQ